MQVLKVILFGVKSLTPKGARSGPRPAVVRWGLHEITPGAIALAAILVSMSFPVKAYLVHVKYYP